MKKIERQKREIDETLKKINSLTRHIKNVEDNCLLLGIKLIEQGEIDLGRQLIANGYVHDASKFYGIEFEHLAQSTSANMKEENAKLKIRMALQHHTSTNKHHPEAWAKGIKDMPDVYLCEMISDWKARSEEFGTSLRDWINEQATKKFGFTTEDKVYKQIMDFVNILCPKPFENVGEQS